MPDTDNYLLHSLTENLAKGILAGDWSNEPWKHLIRVAQADPSAVVRLNSDNRSLFDIVRYWEEKARDKNRWSPWFSELIRQLALVRPGLPPDHFDQISDLAYDPARHPEWGAIDLVSGARDGDDALVQRVLDAGIRKRGNFCPRQVETQDCVAFRAKFSKQFSG